MKHTSTTVADVFLETVTFNAFYYVAVVLACWTYKRGRSVCQREGRDLTKSVCICTGYKLTSSESIKCIQLIKGGGGWTG